MQASERDDALRELGRLAADRREEANLSLEDVYDRTRIRIEFLQGIEEGNYEGFPEIIYIKGFVRTYLRVIGAEDLQDNFMAWLNRAQPQKQELSSRLLGHSGAPRGFKPASHFWLFLVLLLALAGTGGYVWYVWSTGGFDPRNWNWRIAPSEPPRGTPLPENALSAASSEDKDKDAPARDASPDVLPASAEVKPPSPPKPKPYLEIRARGDVWMSVTIGENTVFNRTLRSGGSVSWDLPAQARVRFGRPNMAQVLLNGRDLGLANPKGSRNAETYLYLPDGTHKKAD